MQFIEPNFLLSTLEHIEEAVVTCDEKGEPNFYNRKARELFQIPEGNFPADRWASIFCLYRPDGRTPLSSEENPLWLACKGEKISDQEYTLIRSGKEPHFIQASANPIYDKKGRIKGAVVTFKNTTAEKKADNRFRTIYDQSPISIQILSMDGRTKKVNPAWQKLWGLPDDVIENFILKEYNILQDPLLEEKGLMPFFKRAFSGEVVDVPEILYDPTNLGFGSPRWVKAVLYPIRDTAGEFNEMVLIHIDVTQDHRLEEAQSFLSKISSILISTLDYDQIIEQLALKVVESFAEGCLVDLIQDEKINRLVSKHRDPEKQKLLDELKKRYPPHIESPQPSSIVIKNGGPELIKIVSDEEIRMHCIDDGHYELIKKIGISSHIAVPLESRGRILGSLSIMKTTANCRFDELDLKTALNLSQKASMAIENARLYKDVTMGLKQRDDFISIASHELKTPITSLKLQMQVASRMAQKTGSDTIDTNYVKKLTENSNRQLDRLTRLVEDMLDISRINTGKLAITLQDVNLSTLTREVLSRFSDQLQELEIKTVLSLEDNIYISCDPFRIEQVITNLLSNAVRYGMRRPVEVSLKSVPGFAFLIIRDNGIGISENDQERIFNRFERAISASDVSGLGLGLFITKEIVLAHKGEIYVESQKDQGSVFTVKLRLS